MSRSDLTIRLLAVTCILAGLLGGFGAAGTALSSTPAAPFSVHAGTALAAQQVDQIGGLNRAVALDDQNKHAYVGIGQRLVMIDYATLPDPTEPELTAAGQTLVLPNLVNDIFLYGGYAYLAMDNFGLVAVNTNFIPPAAMAIEGQLPLPPTGNPTGVAVKGMYAFVADGDSGLKIIDISSFDAMEVKQTYAPTAGFSAMSVTLYEKAPNTYAFVSAGAGGLYIVDVTDPLTPQTVYNYLPDKAGGSILYVAVKDQFAYLIETPQYFRILDVTQPGSPQPLGWSDLPWFAARVAVNGARAYVANNEAGVQVFDITNRQAGPLPNLGRISSHPLFVDALALSSEYVFATSKTSGLHIFGLSDFGKAVGSYFFNPGGMPGVARLATVNGADYLFTAGSNMDSYRTYGLADPGQPNQVGVKNIGNETADVVVMDNYAFVPSLIALYTFNVSDPSSQRFVWPDYMDVASFGDSGFRRGLIAAGTNQLYFAPYESNGNRGNSSGIVLLDVEKWNPPWPAHTVLNRLLYIGPVCDMAVDGNRLYVAAGYDGLVAFDMADPSAPVKHTFDTPGYAWSVAVSEGFAYVGDATGGLRILNVVDLDNISEAGSFTQADWGALDVEVNGNYVYLLDYRPTDPKLSLKIFDVTTKTAPEIVGYYDGIFTPIQPNPGAVPPAAPFSMADVGLALKGNYIYLADNLAGINVLYFAPPVTETIGSQGGELVSGSDNTTCNFPAGVFSQDVTVLYTPRLDEPATQGWTIVGIDRSFEIGAFDSNGQPVQPSGAYTITVSYDPAELDGRDENALAFYYWDGEAWVREPTSQVDTTAHTISATPNHFSMWTAGGAPHRILLTNIKK